MKFDQIRAVPATALPRFTKNWPESSSCYFAIIIVMSLIEEE
jgi:hypothetical protein